VDTLLEVNMKEGWGPLCEFLGYELPGWEFPTVNDRVEFNRYQEDYGRAQNRVVARNAIPHFIASAAWSTAGWYAFTHRR
jgi:hypothetical protein